MDVVPAELQQQNRSRPVWAAASVQRSMDRGRTHAELDVSTEVKHQQIAVATYRTISGLVLVVPGRKMEVLFSSFPCFPSFPRLSESTRLAAPG